MSRERNGESHQPDPTARIAKPAGPDGSGGSSRRVTQQPVRTLTPNAVTIEAMRKAAAGRGSLGTPACRLSSTVCMRTIDTTTKFERDYKREAKGSIGKLSMRAWNLCSTPWSTIARWIQSTATIRCAASGPTTATVT